MELSPNLAWLATSLHPTVEHMLLLKYREVVLQPLHGPDLASGWREGPSCLVKREDIMEGEKI
jgi:hypothetical protein